MCLKNLLCLLHTGCFKGNNSVAAFMLFLGTEGRLAPRPHMRYDSQVRGPYHRRSRRVSPFIAKHLRCPHCPTWLSHRSSRRNILRFHEPPPPTSSPVLGKWSLSEADAVEEGKRRRQRGPRSREARQRRLGRGEPNTIGHEEFTILHSNVRGFISRVAEISARLRLMESKPSVLCLTETCDKGLPSLRIEGYTLISRRDRDDGRLRLHAVQVSQQPITTTPPVLRRKCVVSSPLPSCGGKRPRKL